MDARVPFRRVAVMAACLVFLLPVTVEALPEGPSIETIAGGIPEGKAATEISMTTSGFDFDDEGNLFVADPGQGAIWKIDPEGSTYHVAGMGRVCVPDPDRCVADGRDAKEAFLAAPAGLAVGSDGAIYVAEMRGHRVRRIDPQTNVITTYAGNGTSGGYDPSMEGAKAVEVPLWMPQSLAIDSLDRLYVSTMGHRRIYRIDPDGTIRTAAGCGSQTFPTCFSQAQDGSPIESTYVGANAGINGNGWGLAISPSDELYLADTAQILKVDQERGEYRVVAGRSFQYAGIPGEGENGPAIDARFQVTVAMAFAPNGDLYLMEGGGSYANPWNRIQMIEAPAGPQSILRHVGGKGIGDGFSGDGGAAKNATFAFSQPTATWTGQGIAVSPDGAVFIGDIKNSRIRRIDPATGLVTTAAGNGHGAPASGPSATNDQSPSNFQKGLAARGGLSGDGGPAVEAQLYEPADVEVDRLGNVYVLDGHNARVRRIDADGDITTIAGTGCVSPYCGGAPLGDGGPATQAGIAGATAIALDRTGTQLYIADDRNRRVRQVNLGSSGFTAYPLGSAPVTIAPGHTATVLGPGRGVATQGAPWGPSYAGCGLVKPYCGDGLPWNEYSPSDLQGLATDAAGNLYFSDAYASQVLRVEQATGLVTAVAGVPHTSECSGDPDTGLPGRATQLCGPTALTVGPDGDLYIAETSWMGFGESLRYGWIDSGGPDSSRVRKVDLQDPLHTSTLVAGGGAGAVGYAGDGGPATQALLAFPHGLAVGSDGTVYVSDTANSRIRKIAPDGTISTVAGGGEYYGSSEYAGCDLAGDGGAPSDALLCAPLGIALGPDGTLYVADTLNNRVRAIRGL